MSAASERTSRDRGNRQVAVRLDDDYRAKLDGVRAVVGRVVGDGEPASAGDAIRALLDLVDFSRAGGVQRMFLRGRRVEVSDEVTPRMITELRTEVERLRREVSELSLGVQRIGTNVNQMTRLGNEMHRRGITTFQIPEGALRGVQHQLVDIADSTRRLSETATLRELGWSEVVD